MMVTLTKLLEINMVANSLSLNSNNWLILASADLSLSSISLKSLGLNEKKAISEPETKAEAPNKIIAKIRKVIIAKNINKIFFFHI